MKKILLGLGSISAIAAPIVGVVSCGYYDNSPNSHFDKNTKIFMDYIRSISGAHEMDAYPGLKINLNSKDLHYDIEDINKLSPTIFKLPPIFDNYFTVIECTNAFDNTAVFKITVRDQTHNPIETTFNINGFNKTMVKDQTQIDIENSLTTFNTTNTKDLLTYESIEEIKGLLLTEVKSKVASKYSDGVVDLSIEKIKSDSLIVNVESRNNSGNPFWTNIEITGFSTSSTNNKRNAKAKVANAYLHTKSNRLDDYLYDLTIGARAIRYKTKNGKFIKYIEDTNNPDLGPTVEMSSVNILTVKELLSDIFKEIDDRNFLNGDLVKDFYPSSLLAVGDIFTINIEHWNLS